MAVISVNLTDTFNEWRTKTNSLATKQGDLTTLTTTAKSTVVAAINEIDAAGSFANVVEDTSPQLGGNLDVLARSITTSTTNGNIAITPHGSGKVVLDGISFPNADGSNGQVLQTNGSGVLSFASVATDPTMGGDLSGTASNAQLVANAVTATEIASNAVTTAKINADAVDGTKLADNACDSEHYTDGSIDTAHIADDAVTADKLASNSVVSASIVDGTIVDADISNTTITGGKLVNGTITGTQLAANAVTSAKITDGTIVAADIANTTITGAKLVNSTITATQLAANVITDAEVADNALSGNKIHGGTISSFASTGIDDNADALAMTIDSSERVGVGNTSPSEKLHVTGNILATGNVTAYSDERLKTNVQELDNTLNAIQNIRGVSYTRTDTKDNSIGVMAQDVETMFPELISESNDGMKSVNYNGLVGVLFSAVKELSATVKQLKERNN